MSICMKIYCNCISVERLKSVFSSDIVLLLMHRLKIEMEGVYRGLSDLPCINCFYIKLDSGNWIIISFHTQTMKLETLFNLMFSFDNSYNISAQILKNMFVQPCKNKKKLEFSAKCKQSWMQWFTSWFLV